MSCAGSSSPKGCAQCVPTWLVEKMTHDDAASFCLAVALHAPLMTGVPTLVSHASAEKKGRWLCLGCDLDALPGQRRKCLAVTRSASAKLSPRTGRQPCSSRGDFVVSLPYRVSGGMRLGFQLTCEKGECRSCSMLWTEYDISSFTKRTRLRPSMH